MASGRKRKREPIEGNTLDVGNRGGLSLQAFEAVINPTTQQRHIKLANGKSGDVNSDGLIEWNLFGSNESILVDRYDARLLLDTLCTTSQVQIFETAHLGDSWDDLPQDTDDLFFFSLDEAEDIRREKRRRVIESSRETRLRAMKASDPVEPVGNSWGGSDEEPDESEMALMNKTAAYIVASANPVQLEMRILTNHGKDPRFAFLRGRWKRAWEDAKEISKAQTVKRSLSKATGLVTYDSGGEENTSNGDLPETNNNLLAQVAADDARVKAERLARVKEWSRKRKQNGDS